MKNKYYKYRSLYLSGGPKPEINKYTQAIFEKKEVFYAAPKACNDPFDCNFRLHVRNSTDDDWEKYLRQLASKNPGDAATIANVIAQKLWRTNPNLVPSVGMSTQKAHYEESSLFCLSKIGNSIPMFAYYGDNHTGIAIEFTFDDTEVPCGVPLAARGKSLKSLKSTIPRWITAVFLHLRRPALRWVHP